MRAVTRIAAALAAAAALTMLTGLPAQAVPQAAPAPAAPADGRATPVAPDRERTGSPTRAAAADDGPYWLFNANSGKCLTVQNASLANNAPTLQFTCAGGAPFNEDWFLDSNDDGTYQIVNGHSGKCLTVQNASLLNEAPVVQYTCDTIAPFNERWEFIDLGQHPADHWYHIRNVNSGFCLTVKGASAANNAFGVQYACDNRVAPYNEEWQLI